MFGEETEVIVENVGENLETLTELKAKYPDAIDFLSKKEIISRLLSAEMNSISKWLSLT